MGRPINIWFINNVTKITQIISNSKSSLQKNWKKLGCIGCLSSILIMTLGFCVKWWWDAESYKKNPGIILATRLEERSLMRDEEPQTYFFLYMKFRSKPFFTPKDITPQGVVFRNPANPKHEISMDIIDIDNYHDIRLPRIFESRIVLNYNPAMSLIQIQPADSVINEKGTSFIQPTPFPILNQRLFEYPFAPTLNSYADKIFVFKQKPLTKEEKLDSYKHGSQSIYSLPIYCQFKLIGENVPTKWYNFYNSLLGYSFSIGNVVNLSHDDKVKASLYEVKHNLMQSIAFNSWHTQSINTDFLSEPIDRIKYLSSKYPNTELYKIYISILNSIKEDDLDEFFEIGKSKAPDRLTYTQYTDLLDNIFPFSGISHNAFTLFGYVVLQGINKFGHKPELSNYNGIYYCGVGKMAEAQQEFSRFNYTTDHKLANFMKFNKSVAHTMMRRPKDSNIELIKLLNVPYMDLDAIHFVIAENYLQLKDEDKATEEALKIRATSHYFREWQKFMENHYNGYFGFPLMSNTIYEY